MGNEGLTSRRCPSGKRGSIRDTPCVCVWWWWGGQCRAAGDRRGKGQFGGTSCVKIALTHQPPLLWVFRGAHCLRTSTGTHTSVLGLLGGLWWGGSWHPKTSRSYTWECHRVWQSTLCTRDHLKDLEMGTRLRISVWTLHGATGVLTEGDKETSDPRGRWRGDQMATWD